ncbi:MAG: bifunctional serine/threonine-protein kinase/formylglycine-generating enzyme family protein [Paludibacteraceae bacterium]|nr:bifunctional serine/threonine-protein kinase/formylglycine-generating enzyme family protein [Paludibacteraceae bacterium]
MQLTEHTYFGEGNRYYLEKLLGRGGFSEVWLVKDTIMELELVLKVYAPGTGMDEDGLKTFSKELANVFNLHHQNLLKPQHVDTWQGMPYLTVPYCQQGSLVKRIGKMSESEIRQLIHDVAAGLAYLHERDIIHQDIKPDNILIDEAGNYVITDFGISTRARSTLRKSVAASSANSGGTIAYMGPERFGKEPAPIMASDIWSLGAMLYELMTGDTPFGEHGGLIQKSGAEIPTIKGDYSEDLKQLVEKMLSLEPWDRPTAVQLAEWIQNPHFADLKTSHKKENVPTSREVMRETQRVERKSKNNIFQQENKNENIGHRKKFIWLIPSFLVILSLIAIIVYNVTRVTIEQVDQWISDEKICAEIEAEDGSNILTYGEEVNFNVHYKGIAPSSTTCGIYSYSIADSLFLPKGEYGMPNLKQSFDVEVVPITITEDDSVTISCVACIKTSEGEINRVIGSKKFLVERNERIYMVNGISFSMIRVEGGTFTMGATSEQGSDAENDEKPIHSVTLSDYSIGKYEVTQELWQAVMDNNPSSFKGSTKPVESISWDYCKIFISKLNSLLSSQLGDKRFALPTEAQWEYAARGGKKSQGYKYAGSNTIDSVAWYANNSGSSTHEVGTKSPNELGLYDMSGNVWEWCQDRYGSYSSNSQTNPTGASGGSDCVFRGGSWYCYARFCRVSDRNYRTPSNRYSDVGLRLVLIPHNVQEKQHQEQRIDSISYSQERKSKRPRERKQESADTTNNNTNNLAFNVNGVSLTMIRVEGGTFTMGATSEQGSDAENYEKPTCLVTLSDYYIGKYEVTQALWEAVMDNNPSHFKGSTKPVENVSWNDCQNFIRKLNRLLSPYLCGNRFALPTEAQWEYAARGGKKSLGCKYTGSNSISSVAWYNENSGSSTHEVGRKSPNELGLYDMSGNIWEWCQDWNGSYSSDPQTNPIGASSGSYHMLRGGSWFHVAKYSRVSSRRYSDPSLRDYDLGLRLVLLP